MAMKMRYFSILFSLFLISNTYAQIYGCTDPLSASYNPLATVNNGSCTYAAASVAPVVSVALPAAVVETSGLISWGGYIYTHNDNSDTKLYKLDPNTGAVIQTIALPGVTNVDWEEIAQDDEYLYIGDFGNNTSGNRTNLKIYKVSKASLNAGAPVIETINFSYSNQFSLIALLGNSTDFDCEAFVVTDDNIYLFTKQWLSLKTSVYSVPKTAGTYTATLEGTHNVNGLITGATYLKNKNLVVLTGYSTSVQPFLYLLYDFQGNNFFGGNKRKINVSLPFNQIEGITTTNGLDYYVTNEKLVQLFLNIPQKLHRFDLRPYLENYLQEPTVWNGNEWTNGVPDITDIAIIEGNYNSAANGELTAATLTINNGDVVIASGHDFTVKGVVTIAEAATFTIENNANLLQVDDVQNTGIASIEKKSNPLHHLDYTLWSSPVTGSQSLKEFSPQTLDKRFYIYNTAAGEFENYQSASGAFGGTPSQVAFTTAKGYLIRMPHGLPSAGTTVFEGTFTGTPNNGTVTIPLGTGGGRFNMVGNPYPSPISIYAFIDQNQANLENGTLYFWRKTNNPNATSYATVNKLAYIANAAAGGNHGNGAFNGNGAQWVINPGQGFFVKASANAGGLVFTNNMRRAINNGQFFRMDNNETDTVSRLWINIESDSGDFSQTAIGYTPEGTLGLDFGFDGLLLSGNSTAVYTIAQETKLAIQARPQFTEEDVVQLGYKALNTGNYTLSLSNFDGLFAQGQAVYLKDTMLNVTHNLTSAAYSFTTDEGTFEDRFEILYANNILNIENRTATTDGIIVYRQYNSIIIDAGHATIKEVSVHDISGRSIYVKGGINATSATISDLKVNNQVLLLHITTEDNTVVTKKVIN